jgi:hypothetical protein
MANYPNTPPQLGSLDFDTIKSNLTTYLREQPVLKDYAFEGSVTQTLINLLAYNTFYYAYYMNMVANEMFLDSAQRLESVISLVKPLGYTVQGPTSSRAKLLLTGLTEPGERVGKHEKFVGTTNDGLEYTFYTLEDSLEIDADGQVEIIVAEGKELFYLDNNNQGVLVETIGNLDLNKQKYYILNQDVDLSTLTVEVKKQGESQFYQWKATSNIGSPYNVDQKIFFVERLIDGFAIQFGITNLLGTSLEPGDFIKIRYLVSSGDVANNIIVFNLSGTPNFEFDNLSIILREKSSGGLDEPSLDTIKFLAPKLFSAQGRAVTKNDIISLLLEAQLVNSIDEFAVFGGEEIYPPRYGRVFVSLAGQEPTRIQEILDFLKNRCVITILPEYVTPKSFNLYLTYSMAYTSVFGDAKEKQGKLEQVKKYVDDNFLKREVFNFKINGSDIKSSVEKDVGGVSINEDSISLYFKQTITLSNGQITYNFGNEIKNNLIDDYAITTPFTLKTGQTVTLRIKTNQATSRTIFVPIKAFNTFGVEIPGDFGSVNLSKGTIIINDIAANSYVLTIPFKNRYFNSSLNNVITCLQEGVSII